MIGRTDTKFVIYIYLTQRYVRFKIISYMESGVLVEREAVFDNISNQREAILGFNLWSSHTKDSKMVLDAALLNSRNYKVCIKGKVEQSKERSSALPFTSV